MAQMCIGKGILEPKKQYLCDQDGVCENRKKGRQIRTSHLHVVLVADQPGIGGELRQGG